jgi:hypothetical protein
MKKKIVYIEKFNLVSLWSILFIKSIDTIYLLDFVDFFPANVNKPNNFERLYVRFFPLCKIIRVPLFKTKQDFVWEINQKCLDFIDEYNDKNKGDYWRNYLVKRIESEKALIALNKELLPEVYRKMVFYYQAEDFKDKNVVIYKIIPASRDYFKIAQFLKIPSDKQHRSYFIPAFLFIQEILSIFFTLTFNPYIVRDILEKGIRWYSPKTEEYDIAIHEVLGFPSQRSPETVVITNTPRFSDGSLLQYGVLDPKKTLFVRHKWLFPDQTNKQIQKAILNLDANEGFETKNKIPILFFIKSYLLKTFISFYYHSIVALFHNSLNFELLLISQRLIHFYINHDLFCQYYRTKVFFSRDDYDTRHIIRTVVQNKYGLINTGLQHSAFLYPRYLPFMAYTYFDIYYIMGKGFEKLWTPYWDNNKKLESVGTHREHIIIDAMEDNHIQNKYYRKYKDKITILLLISAIDVPITPKWLIEKKYRGFHEILMLDERLHIIIRPRYLGVVEQYITLFPEIKEYIDSGRISIELQDFSTQELITCVNILVAEDASSCLLESLTVDKLFSFYFMIRYGNFEYINGLVVNNVDELKEMIILYLKGGADLNPIISAKEKLKGEFTTTQKHSTWHRIAKNIYEQINGGELYS